MPDDERKGRRLGDETKGRIADLASGWTVDSDAPPVPEPPIKRDTSGPARIPDAPRRKAKTLPPPPPGSAARKALEDKIVELRQVAEADAPRPPVLPGRSPPPVPAKAARGATGSAPVAAGKKRAARTAEPLDLAVAEADKTKENRGAIGIKHDKSASLTTNEASGTIGGDTPAPIFDRAAIAAGQRGALARERLRDSPHHEPEDLEGHDEADEADEDDDEHDALAALVDDLAGYGGTGRAEGRPGRGAADARDRAGGRLGSPPGDAVPRSALDRASGGASRPTAAGSDPGDAVPQRASAFASRPTAMRSGPADAVPARAADRASGAARFSGAASDSDEAASPRGADRASGGARLPGSGTGPRDAIPQRAADRASGASRPTAAGSDPGDAVPQRTAIVASRPVGAGTGPRDAIPQRAADRASGGAARAAGAGSASASSRAETGEDGALPLPAPPGAGLAVPVGEFDQAVTILDQDKRRIAHAQATIKRDAAGALLGLAEPAPARMPAGEVLFEPLPPSGADSSFDEPTRRRDLHDSSSAATGEYGRGDPTSDGSDDATAIAPPTGRTTASGTLRSSAALPRRRGAFGDLRYIATVIFGLRRARRELAEVTARQTTRQQSRRHHLMTLGRAAVTVEGFAHRALEPAREQLARIEDERSQHAGHVVAADAELVRVRREREAAAKQFATDVAALDTELAALARKLEPLHKEAAAARKRGVDLHDALRRLDARIAATEATLDAPKPAKRDRAEIQAEIATLRADRKSIQADEPVIAGQLDGLNPRIASLEAALGEAQRKRAEAVTAEQDDQRRVEELLAAIGAKRKVVDRAAADAETRRDKILVQLGERLYVDRPDDLAAELAPVDAIDVELGSAERRLMELREILTSVDRWKLARGIALLVVIVAALGAIAFGLMYLGWI